MVEKVTKLSNLPSSSPSVRCPSCRSRAALVEISYVNNESVPKEQESVSDIDVRGSFGTKVIDSSMFLTVADMKRWLLTDFVLAGGSWRSSDHCRGSDYLGNFERRQH